MEKIKILAIDDSVVNLATIEHELRDKYEVIPVNSGRRAIKFIQQKKVDLILLDIQMPVMDGIETLKQIREQENGTTVPVIMLTAKHDKATVIEGTKLGIMDYVVKPFEGEDLCQRIDRALKRYGVLPMDEEEFCQRLEETARLIHNENTKQATVVLGEILRYQMDEEISKRLHAAKLKMNDEDFPVAERIIQRVLQMMNQMHVESDNAKPLPISIGELNAKLLFILDALEHFRVNDAAEKLEDLMRYSLPIDIKNNCQKALQCVRSYDDGEAEILIKKSVNSLS